MSRPIVSLGDALRVSADLQPADEEARQAVREMLGFEAERAPARTARAGKQMPSSRRAQANTTRPSFPAAAPPRPQGIRAPSTAPETAQQSEGWLRSTWRKLTSKRAEPQSTLRKLEVDPNAVSAPTWLSQVRLMDVPNDPGNMPAPPPLFGRIHQRGILSAALATEVEEGELDLARIIAKVSAGDPLTSLPRLPVATLRRGAQVLVDVGPAMVPFAQDQRSLVQALDDILADDRLEVMHFAGCPSRGVRSVGATERRHWRPPPHAAPVIVVTDLGIGGPVVDRDRATVAEWRGFAQQVQRAGHLLVPLVPYEPKRWPQGLSNDLTPIHWSERTTIRTVQRAFRDKRRGRES